MDRITRREADGAAAVDLDRLQEALDRLAAYEDFHEEIALGQAAVAEELDALRAQGKEKTVRARELLAQKLMDQSVALRMELHGLGRTRR